MSEKKDAIDQGVEKASDAIGAAVDVVDSFLDWITGPPYSSSDEKDSSKSTESEVTCHCTKKK
jgi:hypothetical protein